MSLGNGFRSRIIMSKGQLLVELLQTIVGTDCLNYWRTVSHAVCISGLYFADQLSGLNSGTQHNREIGNYSRNWRCECRLHFHRFNNGNNLVFGDRLSVIHINTDNSGSQWRDNTLIYRLQDGHPNLIVIIFIRIIRQCLQ